MRTNGYRLLPVVRIALLALLAATCWSAQAQVPDQINYQGRLTNAGGTPINATVSMVLKLYTVATGGAPLYTETQNVTVTNGIFDVAIGSVTPLALPFDVPYYLGVTAGTDAEMTPRQAVLTSPYAFQALSATSATTAQGLAAAGAVTILSGGTRVLQLQSLAGGLSNSTNTVNMLGGSPLNTISAGVVAATIAGGGGTVNGTATLPNSVQADYGTVSGGWGNTARGDFSTVGGGDNNDASGYESAIGGGEANRASGLQSTVAGGIINTASGDESSVGGGYFNNASAPFSTVTGGSSNTASGFRSAVGGGISNLASGSSSTVGGGDDNIASGLASSVGGGDTNVASGLGSTVAGGGSNTASGNYSFAAGRFAKTQTTGASPTIHDGAFVWADASNFDFNSGAFNEFAARATGGVRFVTAIDGSGNPTQTVAINSNGEMNFGSKTRQMIKLWDQGTAHYGIGVQNLTTYFRTDAGANFAWFAGGSHSDATFDPGSGGALLMTLMPTNVVTAPTGIARAQSFLSVSDRNVKTNFAPIDARVMLERVIALPVTTWVYRSDPSTPHVGPVAQDFHAAFGVGSDDKTINSTDEGGVALVAIQGLNQKLEAALKEKDAKIDAQAGMLQVQAARIDSLEQQASEIAALKQQVAEIAGLKQQMAQMARIQRQESGLAQLRHPEEMTTTAAAK